MKSKSTQLSEQKTKLPKEKNNITLTTTYISMNSENELDEKLKSALLKLSKSFNTQKLSEQLLLEHTINTLDINAIFELLDLLQKQPDYEKASYQVLDILKILALKGNKQAFEQLKSKALISKNSNSPAVISFIEVLEEISDSDNEALNAELLHLCACCYLEGTCTDVDISKAEKLFIAAHKNGYEKAQVMLSYIHIRMADNETDYDKEMNRLIEAEKNGDFHAAYFLGEIFLNEGLNKKKKKKQREYFELAASMFHEAAHAGFLQAYEALEFIYSNGYGVLKNRSLAAMYGKLSFLIRQGINIGIQLGNLAD